nr:hypothetical protein Iba_chr14fCG3740 [Ipomoea batatas]
MWRSKSSNDSRSLGGEEAAAYKWCLKAAQLQEGKIKKRDIVDLRAAYEDIVDLRAAYEDIVEVNEADLVAGNGGNEWLLFS